MPVPSTMMVLSEATVGISYFFVRAATNFIIMAGPMVMQRLTGSRWMTASTPWVTKPLVPYEPSSVMIMTSSEQARMRSSRMISSLVRAARTTMTRLPALWKASTMGSRGATPTPPPAQTTVPTRSMCVACPRGPTMSVT